MDKNTVTPEMVKEWEAEMATKVPRGTGKPIKLRVPGDYESLGIEHGMRFIRRLDTGMTGALAISNEMVAE